MTNWVGHHLTITGPKAELRRFETCWIKANGEHFPRWVEGKYGFNRPRPEGELYFSFDVLSPPKPDDWDEWVLARWGMKYVAIQAKIEANDGTIRFTFETADDPSLSLYEELAELFPLLTMEGGYSEYGWCIAGDVRCHGGLFTHVNKSEEFAAEINVRDACNRKSV